MKTILDYLEKTALNYPEKIAFSDVAESVTFGEFVFDCKKIASKIKPAVMTGLRKNLPVAVFDNRDVETLKGMFAVLYGGNYYVVLDSDSPAKRLQKIFDVIKPVAVLGSDKNSEKFSAISTDAPFFKTKDCSDCEVDEKYLTEQRQNAVSTDPIYSLFTSGSTGTPKGAVLTHLNVITYTTWFIEKFDITPETKFGSQTPFYFSMSVSDIFGTVMTGATFHIIPKSYFSFPIQLVRFLNDREINTLYWVPSAMSIVANVKLFDYEKPKFLKRVMFCGEVMHNKQLNYWRKHLPDVKYANLFGPTETADVCVFYEVDREFSNDESLPIGKHCDNCDTFIIDDDGKLVTEQGVIGELYARGPFVGCGYYDNPEKTAAAFVQNPINDHYPEIVYKTGDLVKLNEYGEYVFLGRKDFQIKHLGYRIELGEIETAASCVDNVTTVVCVYDSGKDSIVMIYVGKAKTQDVTESLKTKLPYYMVPNVVIKAKEMPYNANGKIDRAFLKNNYKTLIQGEQ